MDAKTFKKQFETKILDILMKEQSDYLFSQDEVLSIVIDAMDDVLKNFQEIKADNAGISVNESYLSALSAQQGYCYDSYQSMAIGSGLLGGFGSSLGGVR